MEKPIPEDNFDVGPFSTLLDAAKSNDQIVVSLRNNRKILGRVKAFDRHLNIILEDAFETWTEREKGKKKGAKLAREKYYGKLFLRGDSVVFVIPKVG